jgi:hypothetical protein
MALLASEGIPHDDLVLILIDQDGEAMAAAHEAPQLASMPPRHREPGGRDAVGRLQGGSEDVWRWLPREAEEDLLEEILIVQRGHRHRTSIVIVEDLRCGVLRQCGTPQPLGIHTSPGTAATTTNKCNNQWTSYSIWL